MFVIYMLLLTALLAALLAALNNLSPVCVMANFCEYVAETVLQHTPNG